MDTFLEWLYEQRHDPKHVRVAGGDVATVAATPEKSSRISFGDWLLEERSLLDPYILDQYERAFQQQLEALIGRTRDPALRQAFEQMRDCPIQDRNGRCCRFSDYIVGALIRHGITQQYDLEDAVQRIMFWMLSSVGERGLPKKSLFDFDENRPYDLAVGNPLQAIFRQSLTNAVRTVAAGRIPALRRVQYPNRLSINYGRSRQRPGGLWHHCQPKKFLVVFPATITKC